MKNTTQITDKIKMKKEFGGNYIAEAEFNGVKYEVEASLMDDSKSFSCNYSANGTSFFHDGFYGLRLKDIKNTLWKDVIDCSERNNY